MDDVRSLFDAYEPKAAKTFTFRLPSRARRKDAEEEGTKIELTCLCAVSENPGALQSGVFLWPAALSLCEYLCANWWTRFCEYRSFAELGAGSGLPGLLVCRLLRALPETSDWRFLFTDREYACLKMIKESLARNDLLCSNVRTKRLLFEAEGEGLETFGEVEVVLGSDLIYSIPVARNLLTCLKRRFEGKQWIFLLVSSFRDPITTRFIEETCSHELGLERSVEVEKDERGCLIELYKCV